MKRLITGSLRMGFLKSFILTMGLILAGTSIARTDLSAQFHAINGQEAPFTAQEINKLKRFDIYFIPGILAESLIGGDHRSVLDISLITRDYFGKSLDVLNKKYKLNARRLKTSSKDVQETRTAIHQAVETSRQNGRQALLVSHSLGGLALIEELILNPRIQSNIAGIAFLQSPFYGTALSDLFLNPPYELEKYLHPLLPFLNISQETVYYVGEHSRKDFMNRHQQAVKNLVRSIPLYTFTGVATANKSVFKPIIDIMEAGCVRGKDKCISEVFFNGPYDKSDGLIPYKSSFLPEADYVIMQDVDHAEIILNVPFTDYKKEHMTTSWLKLLLTKIK